MPLLYLRTINLVQLWPTTPAGHCNFILPTCAMDWLLFSAFDADPRRKHLSCVVCAIQFYVMCISSLINIIKINYIFVYVASCQLKNNSLDSNVYSQGCVQHPSPLQIVRDSDHKIGNCLGPVLCRIWLLLFCPNHVKTRHPLIWRGCRTSRAAKWRCSMYAHLKMVKGIGTVELSAEQLQREREREISRMIQDASLSTSKFVGKLRLQLLMYIKRYLSKVFLSSDTKQANSSCPVPSMLTWWRRCLDLDAGRVENNHHLRTGRNGVVKPLKLLKSEWDLS